MEKTPLTRRFEFDSNLETCAKVFSISIFLFLVSSIISQSSRSTITPESLSSFEYTRSSTSIERNKSDTDTSWNSSTCFPKQVTDDSEYFQCPPGRYLNRTPAEQEKANIRMKTLYHQLRVWGYERNARENISGTSYLDRGYASYESYIWPKPKHCQHLVNDSFVNKPWSAMFNKTRQYFSDYSGQYYKEDNSPNSINKIVSDVYEFEFHYIWKVASTSFPSYLWCEFWPLVATTKSKSVKTGYKVAGAVRHPLSRFVSAAAEVLQRSINGYCPSGYCTYSHDGYEGNVTLKELKELTTWYQYVENGFNTSFLQDLMEAFVHDTECNYYFYAAEHFTTQSAFINQGGGCAAEIDNLVRLEELDLGLEEMVEQLKESHGGSWKNCSMGHDNVAADKPSGVPSESEMLEILEKDTDLMRRVCIIYAQDFICLGYEVPDACMGYLP